MAKAIFLDPHFNEEKEQIELLKDNEFMFFSIGTKKEFGKQKEKTFGCDKTTALAIADTLMRFAAAMPDEE